MNNKNRSHMTFFEAVGRSLICMLIYLCGAILIIPVAFLVINFAGDAYSWMCLIPTFLALITSAMYRIAVRKKYDYAKEKMNYGERVFFNFAVIEILSVICGIIIIVFG